jgi:hypothetical protein
LSFPDYQAYVTRRFMPLGVSRTDGFLSCVSFLVDLTRRENRSIKRGSASERFGWNQHVHTHIAPINPFCFIGAVLRLHRRRGEEPQAVVPLAATVVPPIGGSTAVATARTTARDWDLNFSCRGLRWFLRVLLWYSFVPRKMGGCSSGSTAYRR